MEYFVSKDGEKVGPISREQVQKMLADGALQISDFVWTSPMKDWVRINQHPDFSSPPPLPPSASERIEPTLGGNNPSIATSESKGLSLVSMYEAFLGPEKSGYYIPVFQGFDSGGSSISWNWAAAFITQLWMLYRGMFLWGFLWYPILGWIASVVAVAGFTAVFGKSGYLLSYLVTIPASFVVMGMYSNKLFHGHVHKLINKSGTLGLSDQLRREWLIRKGAANFVFLIILLFVGVAIIGILAAIAIPAYQDYTIRSQVSEGAVLADGVKVAMAEFYQKNGSFPANNEAAGLEPPVSISGKYVTQVTTSNGVITVTYGGQANPHIVGQVLSYSADTSSEVNKIIWHCNIPNTTLPNKYLPQICRK